ncbi:helix-turn-helix domain-containing protein [Nocardia sp. NPDC050406]|uniref:helix-turn-helix domain-containing protein n=1 Tax=Nocardia sp. NPDC050406 TaxID=3364318 RepID=UPI0037B9F827
MSERLYSVEEVADRLGLHVRTVRGYVRDGKLPAVRIGKQYRIAHDDLATFTGRPVPETPRETAARQRHTEVSSIVEIDAISPETFGRLSSLLLGASSGRTGPDDEPLRVETVYSPERGRLKVIVIGGLAATARLLDYMEGVLAS